MQKDGGEQVEMKKEILEAFQICDSTFPIGTFNHSFGMENYLFRRVIRKAPQFREWLENYYRSQFRYGEGLLVLLCCRAMEKNAEENTKEDLLRYDDLITKSVAAAETREGTRMIAAQMLILIRKIYGDTIPLLNWYAEQTDSGHAYGNPAIAFSIFAYSKGLSCEEAFNLYGYSVASTLVQNAVRSVPLGQREGQVILHDVIQLIADLYEKTAGLDEDSLGANTPGLELAQICHETQEARLFMS